MKREELFRIFYASADKKSIHVQGYCRLNDFATVTVRLQNQRIPFLSYKLMEGNEWTPMNSKYCFAASFIRNLIEEGYPIILDKVVTHLAE